MMPCLCTLSLPTPPQPQKESQKADEYLREIQELGQLTQAVQQCIEAAGHEHQPDMQKSLLRVGLGSRAAGRGTGQGGAARGEALLYCPLALLRRPPLESVSSTDFHPTASCACVRTCVCSMPFGIITSGSRSPIASIPMHFRMVFTARGGRGRG